MWCLFLSAGGALTHSSSSVGSRIHGHGWDLPHAGGGSGGGLLRSSRAHQVIERRSTLNESVKSFLDAGVVKVDAWSSHGGPLSTECCRQAGRRGAVGLWCWSRGPRHSGAGGVLGGRGPQRAVGMRLRGRRGNAAGGCQGPWAAVEQTEDFSLQLLLMTGVSGGAGDGRQTVVAGRLGGERGGSWDPCRRCRTVQMNSCRSTDVTWGKMVGNRFKNKF